MVVNLLSQPYTTLREVIVYDLLQDEIGEHVTHR
jgi:hypothetical protein